jgi:alkylation response protein AidB-like acyl-CoA dehydrogenase
MALLRLLGRANLSLGRLIEAHINAIRLITRYGTPAQAQHAADAALAGHLFALWVTDAPGEPPLLLTDGHTLHGAKAPCSGAGHATRALVTADASAGTIMLLVHLDPGERATHEAWRATGMRAAANGRMDLTGLTPSAPIGEAGDYLRQPDFSAGAWRTSAVTLGGLEALTAAFRAALVARRRTDNPHQRARVGEALIAQETARLWVHRAAMLAENPDAAPDDTAAMVNLARIAAETATLNAIGIVQRGLGMAAFRDGTLTALLFRDLAIYLRQPAPDETLTEAATHFMQREMPEGVYF